MAGARLISVLRWLAIILLGLGVIVGGYSVWALWVAVVCLGVSTVILSVAACIGQDVALALGTVTVPLGGLGGFVYGKAQASKSDPDPAV